MVRYCIIGIDFLLPPSRDVFTHSTLLFNVSMYVDPTIPSLVKFLVPDSAPLPTKRFLRRLLLTPPPPDVASSIANLVAILKEEPISLPQMSIPPIGKVLSLIRAGQASAQVFRDVTNSLESSVTVLDTFNHGSINIVTPLMSILKYESGIDAERNNLKERCLDAKQIISNVICDGEGNDSVSYCSNEIVPYLFFERNEAPWRHRIKHGNAIEAYNRVHETAQNLVEAVAFDFWGATSSNDFSTIREDKNPIVQDVFNNMFAIREIPCWVSKHDRDNYIHPYDRKGKRLGNRVTTRRVSLI